MTPRAPHSTRVSQAIFWPAAREARSCARSMPAEASAALQKFVSSKPSSMADDLDGDPVFLAQDAFSLRYESERYPAIKMVAIKEYHALKAA